MSERYNTAEDDSLDSIEQKNYEKALNKSRTLGWFSLTKDDHESIGSTPNTLLEQNPGKEQYELMSDEEIEKVLQGWVETFHDSISIRAGVANVNQGEFLKALNFLKSVNRLPNSFIKIENQINNKK